MALKPVVEPPEIPTRFLWFGTYAPGGLISETNVSNLTYRNL
jgi:hypothetical protein